MSEAKPRLGTIHFQASPYTEFAPHKGVWAHSKPEESQVLYYFCVFLKWLTSISWANATATSTVLCAPRNIWFCIVAFVICGVCALPGTKSCVWSWQKMFYDEKHLSKTEKILIFEIVGTVFHNLLGQRHSLHLCHFRQSAWGRLFFGSWWSRLGTFEVGFLAFIILDAHWVGSFEKICCSLLARAS